MAQPVFLNWIGLIAILFLALTLWDLLFGIGPYIYFVGSQNVALVHLALLLGTSISSILGLWVGPSMRKIGRLICLAIATISTLGFVLYFTLTVLIGWGLAHLGSAL